jgi:hypothetical protein
MTHMSDVLHLLLMLAYVTIKAMSVMLKIEPC